MSTITDALPLPDVCYDTYGKEFFLPDAKREWIPLTEGATKRSLKGKGYSPEVPDGAFLSPLDQVLHDIQMRQNVAYAASLAGHDAGIYQINGNKILVTDSPRRIEPVEGAWPILSSIIDGMFNDPVYDQRPYLFGWFKIALMALRVGHPQPGQALCTAGPVRSAKSLLQTVITEILGGRCAHPYSYMTGATTFNGELFEAEHLMIEDVAESRDIRTRRYFGARIKETVANNTQHCHPKYRAALTLNPFWRISITLNDDPERLMVLPPMDDDIADKIMLLKVTKRDMPMPTSTADEQDAFWNTIRSELPAFVHFLLTYEIPEELRSSRFGVVHYHHPDLLAALDELSPELRLLELIDQELFPPRIEHKAWKGSAAQLQQRLTRDNSACKRQAENLFSFGSACGTYLGRLENKHPNRVSRRRIEGATAWAITPPPDLDTNPAAHLYADMISKQTTSSLSTV